MPVPGQEQRATRRFPLKLPVSVKSPIGGEAAAAVGQEEMGDPERDGGARLLEEGHRTWPRSRRPGPHGAFLLAGLLGAPARPGWCSPAT